MYVFQKITVAECIETQSKAMTMLTLDQLSYLLKFALQKMKQPGVSDHSAVLTVEMPVLMPGLSLTYILAATLCSVL